MPRLISAAVAALVLLTAVSAPSYAQTDDAAGNSDETLSEDDYQIEQDFLNSTTQIQTDLGDINAVQTAAKERYEAAEAAAEKVKAKLDRDKDRVAESRRIVGHYLRSIYMNGPNELMMIASLIDTQEPGDLVRQAETIARVGGHKDDQFRDAVDLLSRTEESKVASDAALKAAEASLAAVDDQVGGLRQKLADAAQDWAGHLSGRGGYTDPAQIKRNSDAAIAWADYLGKLAKLRVPPVTVEQLRKKQLPDGLEIKKGRPGVAFAKRDGESIVVLPERTIASVTYSVSKLGTAYKWRANTAKKMDCSALVDRAWNVPQGPADQRRAERPSPSGGAAGIAQETRLLANADQQLGDLVFLADKGAGVNHVGIAMGSDIMLAGDAATGAVNAVPVPAKRVYKVGRQSLRNKKANNVPVAKGKKRQCGADPALTITLPAGGTLPSPAVCPPSPGVFSEAHMQPDALQVGRCTALIWPQFTTIYGWVAVPIGPYPDHVSGRAVDVMMPAGCSADAANVGLGNQVAEFYMKNAKRFNVQYMMWQHRIWNATFEEPKPVSQWRMVSERGDCTSNHMDHVHITMNGPNVAPGIGKEFNRDDWVGGSNPGTDGDSKKSKDSSNNGKDDKKDADTGAGHGSPGSGAAPAPEAPNPAPATTPESAAD
ncbi:MAG: C40 family peptidase [Actinomycetia bacterium]|nr:C40 family peptidase [Actinomycetes bacterium]